jgi:hypothetical protein
MIILYDLIGGCVQEPPTEVLHIFYSCYILNK